MLYHPDIREALVQGLTSSMFALDRSCAQSINCWAPKQDCEPGPVCRPSMGRRG